MLIDILHETIRIFTHLKEICLFLRTRYRASAIRALPVHKLRIRPEGLARRTVPALVLGLVDVALVIHLLKHLLDLLLMVSVRRPDELIIGGVHEVPDRLDLTSGLIDKFLRRLAGRFGLLLDLLAVLIGTGLEADIIALESLISRDRIGEYDFVGVADMRLARCISDCSCNIVRFLFHRDTSFSAPNERAVEY